MELRNRLRVLNPEVISEVIDDEVVVVNLDSGSYYSLRDLSARVWERIERGDPLESIAGVLRDAYSAPEGEVERGLLAFAQDLVTDGLVEVTDGRPAGPGGEPLATPTPSSPFPGLSLERFDDMAELLQMDPIHEVDERGWPHPGEKSS